ncbi:APC family permease, partial [Arthrobacter sp.]|uniref:APC family permease n=1 Tax=Arthrobacter sp. TaxID=1667 RepID=UPI00258EC5EC
MSSNPPLARRLGTGDAVVIGLGSMMGAGVFAAFSPAAQAAGSGLLIGLAVAGVVAYCNATSSAQLAAAYPTSGGTYIYGRKQLGPWPGFVAGWGFVVGKTASSAAMAMTFAAYVAPSGWERPVAVAAVVLLTAVNYRGVTRTAALARVIVAAVLMALAVSVAAVWAGGPAGGTAGPWGTGVLAHGWYGILQSAGLLFFAFAGYARIATLGEEVKDPRRTIPRAILAALAMAAVVYAAVAVTVLAALGPDAVAATPAPLAEAVATGTWSWAVPVVRVGAALASLGALLALVAGLGRTSLAMAREGDLPHWLAAVHPRFQVPHRAELALGAVVCVIIAFADLRGAIGFSSFGVLLYYLVANVS